MDRNRLYRADCKIVAEQLKRENVQADLIYLDPPFNSNRTYSMIFNNRSITAQQQAYHDMWDFTDRTRQLVMDFRDELSDWDVPDAFKEFMRAWLDILESGDADDRRLLNYLMYMAQRLIRLRDVLKPTGSIYLHCDPTASHYLKVVMDGVFGRKHFQNEVIWKRTGAHGRAKRWGPIHDVILFYTRSDRYTWNRVFQPYDQSYIDRAFRYSDECGKYRAQNLTGPGTRQGDSGKPWRGVDPTARGRHWELPPDRILPPSFEHPEGYSSMSVQERLDVLDAADLIYWPPRGNVPSYKQYLASSPGNAVQDIVLDITPVLGRESLGYATQKPRTLLERIVQASSNPGDLVLDPFCGCGTTVHAAEALDRRWIGVDISGDAVDEIRDRMADIGVYEGRQYDVHEGTPDTVAEYSRLNPFEKQDWLIRRLGGLPNPRKSGDHGIDGDLTFHLGGQDAASDEWGRLIFSVKTGKQRKPEHVRELIGTMRSEDAQIGALILDADPTPGMELAAQRAGRLTYQARADFPPKTYEKVQIFTAYEIMDGATLDCPPSMHDVRRYRELQTRMQI